MSARRWSFLLFLLAATVTAQEAQVPDYLRDRGTGVPSSMFGTYIRRGELVVYPYYEYYKDDDYEYKPEEMGYGVDEDFRGRYRASEWLLFLGYGFTDRLVAEFEVATISAELQKSPDDPSALPETIEESGLGDVEAQLRYRFLKETADRPEIFGYFETVFPLQEDKLIIGTQDWEFKAGAGGIMGFSWGTMTVRASLGYEESTVELGEYAVEYLKRLSRQWRIFAAIEGTQDEVELIAEAQWHITPRIIVKLNNAVGLTSKATDWAPEVGVMFFIPTRTD
jgi:hypothetical protein